MKLSTVIIVSILIGMILWGLDRAKERDIKKVLDTLMDSFEEINIIDYRRLLDDE